MTDDTAPEPDDFRIPTIAELDAMRVDVRLSQRELSRRAGLEEGRFNSILHKDMDPQIGTMRALLDVLREAEPRTAEEIERTGPKPSPSEHTEDHRSDADADDVFWQKLDAMDPDDLGDDPSPPDPEARPDGGQAPCGDERLPWCENCEAIAVPTEGGDCGECGGSVVFKEGSP